MTRPIVSPKTWGPEPKGQLPKNFGISELYLASVTLRLNMRLIETF